MFNHSSKSGVIVKVFSSLFQLYLLCHLTSLANFFPPRGGATQTFRLSFMQGSMSKHSGIWWFFWKAVSCSSCTGPRAWSHYFSGCAALTFSARSTMDRERDECHRTRRARAAQVPQNDGWGEHRVLHAWGASDEEGKRPSPNFSGVADGCCCGACRSGQGRLLLPGSKGCCSVFLLRGDSKVLGAGGQPGGRAQEAFPHMLLRSWQSRGKYSTPGRVLGLRGWPAVESAPEDDHGWPGDGWTSCLPRDGGRRFPAHHLPQLAHGSLSAARCSGEGRIFLHRCWYFR